MPIVAALPAIGSAVGIGSTIAGMFGNKSKGGQTISAKQMIPEFQAGAGQKLAEWIKKYMDQYAPGETYPGALSAGMSSQEQSGMSLLDQFLGGSNIGDLFKAGKSQVLDTLSGKYADPNASPFIKAMKNMSAQDLQDAINKSTQGLGARGKFFSTAALGETKDLTSRNLTNLNSIIGNFIQNERQNMLSTVPLANAMDEYELTTAPLAKVGASQTYGALSRTLEQADYERRYNDYLRKHTEMAQPISVAQGLYSTQQPYGIQNWQMPKENTNSLSSLLSTLGGLNWGSMGGGGTIWSKLGGLFGGK